VCEVDHTCAAFHNFIARPLLPGRRFKKKFPTWEPDAQPSSSEFGTIGEAHVWRRIGLIAGCTLAVAAIIVAGKTMETLILLPAVAAAWTLGISARRP
jgi:hypothetical protein